MDTNTPNRFEIKWSECGYSVSIPNLDGAEVVTAEYHDFTVGVLKQIIDSIPQKRDWLDPDLEKAAKAIIRKTEGK